LADASNVRLLNIPKRHHWSLCSQVTIHGSGTCAGAILLGMLRTAFTELVGCQVPIQLAPMGGGVVTPELAIAVSGAGGLGMLQRADPTPLADRITQLEQAHTPSRAVTGAVAAMALYAGQVTDVTPAAQVVAELAQDTARLLGR
jgi:NAD(P)H-dependent flavin oxidoreductase YrpB (nitropropane dioxygenase family)